MSSVCRICLAGNTRLYSIKNNLLIDVYEKLSSTKFYAEDARPRVLCCFCYRKLLKCHTLFQIADRSEKIFSHLYDKGLKATHEYITEVNLGMKPQLSVVTVQHMNIAGNTTNADSKEIIKHEPIPFVDIKEEATTEQDEWVAVESVLDDCTNSQLKSEDDDNDQGDDLEEVSYSIDDEETKLNDSKMIISCNTCHKLKSEDDNNDQGDDLEEVSYSIDDEETKLNDSKMIITCNTCHKTFVSESKLISHIRNSHFQLKGRQQSSTKQYTVNTSIIKDKIIHTQKKTFVCHVCDKEFVGQYQLNSHMRRHVEKPYASNVCDKKNNDKHNSDSHMRTHTTEKPFFCNVCVKPFNSKQYLIIHMRNHTGEKPYVCSVCDKKFKQTPHLISHMRIHTGEKPFACKVCDKQFSHKRSLDFHMKCHTGAQPFVCNECKKQYKLKSDLVRHMRNHTGGMPLACNVCNKPFNLNRDLVRHMRKHTKEMPFACTVCHKKFSLKCNLVTHVRIHTDCNLK